MIAHVSSLDRSLGGFGVATPRKRQERVGDFVEHSGFNLFQGDAQTVRAIAAFADAVVIGSRIVEEIEQAKPEEAAGRVQALLEMFRGALEARTVAA